MEFEKRLSIQLCTGQWQWGQGNGGKYNYNYKYSRHTDGNDDHKDVTMMRMMSVLMYM